MKDLDKLAVEVFSDYSRNAHFTSNGSKLAYYAYEGDSLHSFVDVADFVIKCKQWIIKKEGYSAESGMSSEEQWFRLLRYGIPVKTVTCVTEHGAAAEVCIWLMALEGEKDG